MQVLSGGHRVSEGTPQSEEPQSLQAEPPQHPPLTDYSNGRAHLLTASSVLHTA